MSDEAKPYDAIEETKRLIALAEKNYKQHPMPSTAANLNSLKRRLAKLESELGS